VNALVSGRFSAQIDRGDGFRNFSSSTLISTPFRSRSQLSGCQPVGSALSPMSLFLKSSLHVGDNSTSELDNDSCESAPLTRPRPSLLQATSMHGIQIMPGQTVVWIRLSTKDGWFKQQPTKGECFHYLHKLTSVEYVELVLLKCTCPFNNYLSLSVARMISVICKRYEVIWACFEWVPFKVWWHWSICMVDSITTS